MSDVSPRPDAYPTFDAFFTRPLRPGAREISLARVVAPADGRLIAVGRIERSKSFRVKAQDYAADELIGEPAGPYIGGSYAVIYLAPGDYHRVHAPVDGHSGVDGGVVVERCAPDRQLRVRCGNAEVRRCS